MLFVGTISLKQKGCLTKDDFPFDKLSGGADRKTERGWCRRAIQKVDFPNRRDNTPLTIQATIWKDKKMVGLLHLAQVKKTGDETVDRWDSKQKKRIAVTAPPVIYEYSDCMGAVDMNDGDGANYPISFRSNRWYLRLFAWTLERVIHAAYQIVIFLANSDPIFNNWKKYTSKQDGRYKFQVDLACQLVEYGIRLDWTDPNDDSTKPSWVRQAALVPCSCGCCFFCKEGMTSGIAHGKKPKKRRTEAPVHPNTPEGHDETRQKIGDKNNCKFCYQRLKDEGFTPAEIRNKKKKTTHGCTTCRVHVCHECWPTFDHSLEHRVQDD